MAIWSVISDKAARVLELRRWPYANPDVANRPSRLLRFAAIARTDAIPESGGGDVATPPDTRISARNATVAERALPIAIVLNVSALGGEAAGPGLRLP